MARTLEGFGRLEFAVNCAGAGGDMAPLESTSQAVWDDVMSVNARGVWLAMRSEIPAMMRSVALEYAARGVRVNAICAGVTRTAAMIAAEVAVPALVNELVMQHPMGRISTEDEIAATALWLCSTDSGFVTGAPIFVDGGFLAA